MNKPYQSDQHYLIVTYVPKAELEVVKEALWGAGAGNIGNYERCGWQTLGCGMFRPKEGSNPTIGNQLEDTMVEEYRLEMSCLGQYVTKAIAALIQAHPYETPAYSVLASV